MSGLARVAGALAGWKEYAVVLAAGALLVAGVLLERHWYGALQYRAGVDKANADHTLAELAEFKAQTARIGGISATLEGALAALREAKPKTIERIREVFSRIDEVSLYSGKVIQGAVISRGATYSILTTSGVVNVPESQVRTVKVVK